MKNRLLCVAMAALCAVGMISCGNPAEPEIITITPDNAYEYIASLGSYEGLTVSAEKLSVTDSLIEDYAQYYYAELAKGTKGLTDSSGDPVPMTDAAIKKLNSEVYGTVSEYMVFIRDTVEAYVDYDYDEQIAEAATKEASSNSEFKEFPEGLLLNGRKQVEALYNGIAESYGVELEYYLELCGTTEDELAIGLIEHDLTVNAIAADLGLSGDADSIEAQVSEYLLSVTNVEN